MSIGIHRFHRGSLAAALGLSLLFLQVVASPAGANFPVGACCFPNGTCEEIVDAPCMEQGGAFIGEGTMCANLDCSARVAAPVFSILGMVGVVGALSGLGVYRLIRRQKNMQD